MTPIRSSLAFSALLALVLPLAGCSGTPVQVGAPAFEGLDPVVVAEVLGNPAAQARAQGDEPAVALERYQGMVRNFTLCRDALQAYQTWQRTGSAPALAAQPQPANPASTAKDMDADIERVTGILASGEISLLYDELTRDSGCGDWVPASPGDPQGPTVADVVEGKS